MSEEKPHKGLTYADAGVDIAAGNAAVERIKKLAKATFNANVLTDIGAFGGFFKPDLSGLQKPVLISSADGVGTKLKLAFMTGKHDTVGEDLVNHCVNDILVHGARALFFLDYIATGHLEPEVVAEVVGGLSRGCKNNGMALLGGETAEMPDFYSPGEYDLAGFIVGLVDEDKIINGAAIKEGHICLGLSSSGLHTNGYTLARKVAFEIAGLQPDTYIDELEMTIGDALLTVHRSYAEVVHRLLEKYPIHGMAHVTGGGIPGNLKRILPANCDAHINTGSWSVPPVFTFLQQQGNIDTTDIYSAFNMGIGFILVVDADTVNSITHDLQQMGEAVYRIGTIVPGSGKVMLQG